MNIKDSIKLLIACSLLLLNVNLFAQQNQSDKPVATRVVEVTHEFKGEITDADRIAISLPKNDSMSIFKSSFDYTTNPFQMPVFSLVKNIAPAMVEEKNAPQKENYGYARFGVGAPLSVLGDVYLHYQFNKRTIGNFYYNHRSYWANKTLLTDQPEGHNLPTTISGDNSQNDLGLSLKHLANSFSLYFEANYKHRNLIFHGHDTAHLKHLSNNHSTYIDDIRDNSKNINDLLKQSYDFLNAKAGIASNRASDEMAYNADIYFGYTHGKAASVNEYMGGLNFNIYQPIQDVHFFSVGLEAMAYNKGNVSNLSDGIFVLSPTYVYKNGNIKVSAGLDIEGVYQSYDESVARDSGKLSTNVYPNVSFSGTFLNNLTLYAKLGGGTCMNTYQRIAYENPYILPDLIINNTKTAFDITAGVRGNIFNTIGYNIFGKYAILDSMYYFINSTQPLATTAHLSNGYIGNNFEVIYHKTKQFTLGADINYASGNFEAIASGRYYIHSFDNEDLAEAWHKPAWELALNLRYKYDNFTFQLGLDGRGKTSILYTSPTIAREARKLDASFDLSAQVEYRVNKWFTAFVYGANLMNQQSQSYYLYYNARINGGAGITLAF